MYAIIWIANGLLRVYVPIYDWLTLVFIVLILYNAMKSMPVFWLKNKDSFVLWCFTLYVTSSISQAIAKVSRFQLFVPIVIVFLIYVLRLEIRQVQARENG